MELKKRIDEYFQLLKVDKKKADSYYMENLLDEVCQSFKDKVDKMNLKYRYLIMPVGFSPEPLIMWIRAIQPQKVFFLCDHNTLRFLDVIINYTGIRPSQYKYEEVESSDVIEIYKEIKEYIEKNNLYGIADQVAVDITGGKKSMVSGFSLAANYLGIDTIYVDYEKYDPQYRKPLPCTEYPIVLRDPLEVFGDRELQQGISKFNSGDFIGAKEIFNNIKNRVANPKLYEMYEYLADGYRELEGMNFDKALEKMKLSVGISNEYKLSGTPVSNLKGQLEAIEPLCRLGETSEIDILSNPGMFWHTLGYSMAIAQYYLDGGKSDQCALLSYRCLEMLIQYLLYKRGIYASQATYDHINMSREELIDRINKAMLKVNPKSPKFDELRDKVGLMDGLIILKVLEEPLASRISEEKVYSMSLLRNKSRFAHGFKILEQDKVKDFYYYVEDVLSGVWSIEKSSLGTKMRFDSFINRFKFKKID